MNTAITKDVLDILVECQKHCAPITLTLGGVRNGIVVHGGVSISDAPSIAIETLIKNGFSLSMEDDVFCVDKFLVGSE